MDFILRLVSALNDAGARCVVVGGVAVVLHGHPRLTVDLDLVIDLAPDNVLATMEVLGALGLVPRLPVSATEFADPAIREQWHRERGMVVFSLHDPDNPLREVDLFAHEPIPFAQLWAASQVMQVGGVDIRVADIAHLIEMKRQAGRPQDLSDIEALQTIAEEGGQ